MNKATLGASDLSVFRLGLGCMGMSEFYGAIDAEQESINTLHKALEMGIDFYDTADIYGNGHNEQLVGKAFHDRRDRVVLATKFGIVRDEQGNFQGMDCSPDYVKKACDRSLKNLGLDVIDLYYAHRLDDKVPVEDTVGAMKELVAEGKVRYLGLSEASAEQLRRAHAVHPITALQTEYSMWSREPEGEIFNTCQELNIAFVAYSPLGRGFLTGAIPSRDTLDKDDWRLTNPRFQEEAIEENKKFVVLIEEIAKEKKVTPAQVALAWVLHQGQNMFPIPGTRKVSRLKENMEAANIQFSEEELSQIQQKLPKATAGERY